MHDATYLHKLIHNLSVIDLVAIEIFAPLNWHSACGFNQPAGERPMAELSRLCRQPQHITRLHGVDYGSKPMNVVVAHFGRHR